MSNNIVTRLDVLVAGTLRLQSPLLAYFQLSINFRGDTLLSTLSHHVPAISLWYDDDDDELEHFPEKRFIHVPNFCLPHRPWENCLFPLFLTLAKANVNMTQTTCTVVNWKLFHSVALSVSAKIYTSPTAASSKHQQFKFIVLSLFWRRRRWKTAFRNKKDQQNVCTIYVYYSFHFSEFCFHSGCFCTLPTHLGIRRGRWRRRDTGKTAPLCELWRWQHGWRRRGRLGTSKDRGPIWEFGCLFTCDNFITCHNDRRQLYLAPTQGESDAKWGALFSGIAWLGLADSQTGESGTLGWRYLKDSFRLRENWCSWVV